jgi:hypothetical protein
MRPVLRLLLISAVALAGSACTDSEPDVPPNAGAGGSAGKGGNAGSSGSTGTTTGGAGGTNTDAGVDADAGRTFDPDASYPRFCDLPGSVQFTAGGKVMVGGAGDGLKNLEGLTVPTGFCAHLFGNVGELVPLEPGDPQRCSTGSPCGGNPRQMRFSLSGDLFVASPTTGATGGGVGGFDAILILPDDNKDGFADTAIK